MIRNFALAVVLSLVAFPAFAQTSKTNILTNPSFEEGGLFSPTDWDTTVAGVPTVLFYWDPEVTHGGKRAISIVNAGDVIPIWHNWNQMIPDAKKYAGKARVGDAYQKLDDD